MTRKHLPYAAEFRRQMIELVRAGRRPEELAKEFEPSAQAIRNWVTQADRDEGRRADGLTTVEREELSRLRRENRQLGWSGRFYQKPRPGSLGRRRRSRRRVRIRERVPGPLSDRHHVPRLGRLPQRLLCVSGAAGLCACREGRRVDREDPRDARGLERHLRSATPADRSCECRHACGAQTGCRLMRSAGLAGVSRRKRRTVTTVGMERVRRPISSTAVLRGSPEHAVGG